MQKTKLLFISWDGPQTTYMEGLFLPIFHKIQELYPQYQFHILQFTWGDIDRIKITADKAKFLGIIYNSYFINRKSHIFIGSVISIIKGIGFIKKYISQNNIDIIMPRSTLPAIMVNRLKTNNIIFDADGLPIDERVDFSNLQKGSLYYKILKREESRILIKANAVITRSKKAIDIHVSHLGEQYRNKFFKVTNGKDINNFFWNEEVRKKLRNQLKIHSYEKIFIYIGSLGPQYCLEEMFFIFSKYLEINSNAKFFILSGSCSFLSGKIPCSIQEKIIVKEVPINLVPSYLNMADLAFAIRKPTYSMLGVAPIKLNEYLLTGLPTIASKGIGDTDNILEKITGCFLYDHTDENKIDNVLNWIASNNLNRENIANPAKNMFSLEKSAEEYIRAIQFSE